MNILFTCVGRRGYLIDFFREELGGLGTLIGTDIELSAPGLAFADRAIKVPNIYDPDYVDIIVGLCVDYKIDAVISLNDLELPVLSKSKDKFEQLSIQLLVSSLDVIDICFDKLRTFEFAASIGIKAPKTFTDLDEVKHLLDINQLAFPLIIKPRWGSGSIGVEVANNIFELDLLYSLVNQKVLGSSLSAVSSQDIAKCVLIQEMLIGTEYGVDILNDFESNCLAVYAKEKLAMRAGETDKSILRNSPEIEDTGILLGTKLGHIGNLDCDFFVTDNGVYLLELNPRFGGGYPFTHVSGGNYVKALVKLIKGEDISRDDCFRRSFDKAYAKQSVLVELKNFTR